MDLATDRVAIIDSASGSRNFWTALDHLPPIARFGEKSDDRSRQWANASLGDYVIVAEYLRIALSKLASADERAEPNAASVLAGEQKDDIPKDIQGVDRGLYLHCRYSASSTVPQLIATRKVIEASEQTSLLIYQLWTSHKGLRTQLGVKELEETRSQLGWVEPSMLNFMLSPTNGLAKLPVLQKAVNSLSVTASWLYASIAINRWPPSLSGEDGMMMLRTILVAAATVMTKPDYLLLTHNRTWETLSEIVKVVAKSFSPAIREKIKAAQAPSGSRFVAVLDPTSALYAAAIGVVGPALKGMRKGKDDGSVDRAVRTYARVRAGFRRPEMDRTTTHDQYTDFVIPEEGDGLWPASVPEVEYLVRDLLVLRGMDGEALNTPQELIAEVGGGWIWLRTPWALPIDLLENENAQHWHRRAPLLGWMIHASTNPGPEQNFCANHDAVVGWVRAAWASDKEGKRYDDIWNDLKSVAIPGAIGTGILFTLFPDVPHAAMGALAAMIYPLIKLFQKAREPDEVGPK
jgi:hypothetical protein